MHAHARTRHPSSFQNGLFINVPLAKHLLYPTHACHRMSTVHEMSITGSILPFEYGQASFPTNYIIRFVHCMFITWFYSMNWMWEAISSPVFTARQPSSINMTNKPDRTPTAHSETYRVTAVFEDQPLNVSDQWWRARPCSCSLTSTDASWKWNTLLHSNRKLGAEDS